MDINPVPQIERLAGGERHGFEPGPGRVDDPGVAVPDEPADRGARMTGRDEDRDSEFSRRDVRPQERRVDSIFFKRALDPLSSWLP